MIDFLIDLALCHQLVVGADVGHFAVIQNDDLVGVPHRADALSDEENGGVFQVLVEGLPDEGFGGGVHSGGGVVQDEDGGFAEHSPGDAQALLLAAGDVDAALFQPGVEALGEGQDEVVSLGVLGRLDDLLFGGVRVAPQQILPDGAGEQDVVLEHHADAVAQVFQGIVLHVDAVHQHFPFRGIVKPGDEIDQGGLALAGAADDGNHLAGLSGEGDVGQDVIAGARGVIFKGDIPKFHLTSLFWQSFWKRSGVPFRINPSGVTVDIFLTKIWFQEVGSTLLLQTGCSPASTFW